MVEITLVHPKPALGFTYSDAPQRSPEWVNIHVGRVGASQLGKWLAVGKRDGKPLKARLDLEREIAFAKAFGIPFTHYTTAAMQAGNDYEGFVRQQYSAQTGVEVETVGCFYNDHFVASPDGLIGDHGGLEIKWLQDSNWTEVVASGKPLDDHYLQMQGNLYASGRKWWDYVAANPNTGRFVVIRVDRDNDTINTIAEKVQDVADVAPLATDHIFEFSIMPPVITNEESIWN